MAVARFFVIQGFEVGGSGCVSRSLVSNSGLACSECGLYHAVFSEKWEEPPKRSLSNLVVDSSGSFVLQDRVPVFCEDVVDAADSEALAEESKFCLRVLTQLDTFVRGSNDVRLGQ